MAATSSPPWCRRPENRVSTSSCRGGCWRRSCHPHLQQSRHREDESTLPLAVAGKKKEINPHCQKTWHGETLTSKELDLLGNLLKTVDPYFLRPPVWCQKEREGGQWWWGRRRRWQLLLGWSREESRDSREAWTEIDSTGLNFFWVTFWARHGT
jgi:hypothetical protein